MGLSPHGIRKPRGHPNGSPHVQPKKRFCYRIHRARDKRREGGRNEKCEKYFQDFGEAFAPEHTYIHGMVLHGSCSYSRPAPTRDTVRFPSADNFYHMVYDCLI
jgi:hypothetical protein